VPKAATAELKSKEQVIESMTAERDALQELRVSMGLDSGCFPEGLQGPMKALRAYFLTSQVDGGFQVDVNLTRLHEPGPSGWWKLICFLNVYLNCFPKSPPNIRPRSKS